MGAHVLLAYDITIIDAEGNLYKQSEADEPWAVTVSDAQEIDCGANYLDAQQKNFSDNYAGKPGDAVINLY